MNFRHTRSPVRTRLAALAAALITSIGLAAHADTLPGKGVKVQPVKSSVAEELFQHIVVFKAGQFTDKIGVFGTNTVGTVYPPNQNPALSWMPAYCRVRVDYYKLATDDPELTSARGPFIDVDILGQRRI